MGLTWDADAKQAISRVLFFVRPRVRRRVEELEANENISLLESPEYKRKWEPILFQKELGVRPSNG